MKLNRIFVIIFLFLSAQSFAQSIKVAAAANLQSVIQVLATDFTKKTGVEVEPIVSSSGNLLAQIKNGAPYDIFLSADMTFPEALYKRGLSAGKPIVYAQGVLIICSSQDIGFENWERMLLTDRVKKIAIANPAIAPYGKAADQALKHKGILADVKPKVVTGESISQVNTYITTGVADVGFTTQALVKDPDLKGKLYWQAVDPGSYAPIEQGMILLKRAAQNQHAQQFYRYMQGPAAKVILMKYGYKINKGINER